MKLAAFAVARRRSLLFLLAIAVLSGVIASLNRPVALFPQISFPRVAVSLDAGDKPAEQMTAEVTRPIEQAVKSVPGVTAVRSTTSRGTAEVSITKSGAWTRRSFP